MPKKETQKTEQTLLPTVGGKVQLTPAAQRFLAGDMDFAKPDKKGAGSVAGSDAEAHRANGESAPMPSYKVHGLAGDIARLEDRCNFLEDRNIWLTQKLLAAQRQFINRTLAVGGKGILKSYLERWREAMHELRLERQLDEQTRSLDQVQSVTKELGHAVAMEQAQRANVEEAHNKMMDELMAARKMEDDLKNAVKSARGHLSLLERRVHEAENCLVRSAAEARAIIETANEYESHWKSMESEHKDPIQHGNLVEHSIKLRGEAHGVMKKASSLLAKRGVSPERD